MARYTAQDLGLDYFKLYDAANQQAGNIVALQGQFDRQPERVQLTYLDFFANPASKNGEPIYDENAHLTWYDIYDPSPDPIRLVTFANQFSKSELYIGRSLALLVPTWKIETGGEFPERLDHYKVYQALQGEVVDKAVKVRTQFDTGSEDRVYHPFAFAVPVKKWYEGKTYGVHNEKAHLVIYRIYPSSIQKTIKTRDQFSSRIQNLARSVLLAAPSEKLAWKEMD